MYFEISTGSGYYILACLISFKLGREVSLKLWKLHENKSSLYLYSVWLVTYFLIYYKFYGAFKYDLGLRLAKKAC